MTQMLPNRFHAIASFFAVITGWLANAQDIYMECCDWPWAIATGDGVLMQGGVLNTGCGVKRAQEVDGLRSRKKCCQNGTDFGSRASWAWRNDGRFKGIL